MPPARSSTLSVPLPPAVSYSRMPLPASSIFALTPMFVALMALSTSATVLNVPPVAPSTTTADLTVRVGDLK